MDGEKRYFAHEEYGTLPIASMMAAHIDAAILGADSGNAVLQQRRDGMRDDFFETFMDDGSE